MYTGRASVALPTDFVIGSLIIWQKTKAGKLTIESYGTISPQFS
jgi:hypothetical protein